MKKILLMACILAGLSAGAQVDKNLLMGRHWAGAYIGDSILFTAFKKYDSKLYQWGSGYAEGKEFFKDSTSNKYYNVLCSSESDPKQLIPSKWWLKNDTLIIDSYDMTETYKVLQLTKKKLLLRVINLYAKEIKSLEHLELQQKDYIKLGQ